MSSDGTVLMVADYAAPYPGNFIASQVAVAAAVRRRLGMDFVFVLPDRAAGRPWVGALEADGMRVEFLPSLPSLRAATRLRSLAAASSAHIIHSHFTGYDLHCSAAAARRDARVLWHIRNGLWGYSGRQRAKDLVKVRMLGRWCDVVVANSQQTGRDSLLRGFPPEKVQVVLNGIVTDRFEPATGHSGPLTVLGFCWDPARKGADVLVQAVARLQDGARRPSRLVLVGQEKLLHFLHTHVGSVLPDWLEVRAPVEDVAALLESADIFVSASREDAFSYAIGEAMAAGLPVVSSDIPGPAHYFEAGGVFTYPVEDANDLARLLGSLGDSEQRNELGRKNRDFVRTHLGIERHVEGIIALYERLLVGRH